MEKVLEQPQIAAEIGANAAELVRNRHNNARIIENLVDFYASLLKK
jgi:hypothetical protein